MKEGDNGVSGAGSFTGRVIFTPLHLQVEWKRIWDSLSEVRTNWEWVWKGWESFNNRCIAMKLVKQKYQANKESMANWMIIDFKWDWPMWL